MIGFSLVEEVESFVALSCQELRRIQEAIGPVASAGGMIE